MEVQSVESVERFLLPDNDPLSISDPEFRGRSGSSDFTSGIRRSVKFRGLLFSSYFLSRGLCKEGFVIALRIANLGELTNHALY